MSGPARRIVYLVNSSRWFLSHRFPLAVAARESGFEVHIAAPAAEPESEEIRSRGYQVHEYPLERAGSNPLTDIRTITEIARIYRDVRPHIAHHVAIKPVLYGSLVARTLRVPAFVNAVTGLGYVFMASGTVASARKAAVTAAYRIACGYANSRVIFQNPDDLESFVRARIVPAGRAVLIRGSGVNLSSFPAMPEPPGVPVVMFPSRMLWDKGLAEFVEAARRVHAVGVPARFVLVGDVDYNRTSVDVAQLRAWESEHIVEWWGHRSDMPAALAQSTIVCLPSYREGLPKALLEGASTGRALVTTDVPGCREVVRNGDNGLLVPVGDADALARAIIRLLQVPTERHQMAARSRQRAQDEFSIDRVVKETLQVYRSLHR
ncbi:MAG TPA: glycosyltransferase family 4 protein [Gemmatimonadaceae bacterium]